MNKKVVTVGLCLFINYAAAIVPASVDHTDLTLGQSLNLTIDVSNTSSDPDLSVLNSNFKVYGTSSSSQTSIINGHMSSQKNMIVTLEPKNIGQQIIPSIKVGNDTTKPIEISIAKPSNSQIAAQNRQVFIDAKINNSSSYIGVPIIYTLKLYYAVNLSNVNLSKIDMNGATIQPLGKNLQYSEQLKDNQYQVIEQKFQITPNIAGNLTIPAITINGNMFNANANSFLPIAQPNPFSVSSKPISLSVKPIPAGISAHDWFPAKQVMISESQTNTTNLKVGQPITRTVVVQALGIPSSSIPDIQLATPNNVNAYPDKTVSNDSFSSNDIVGSKTFKIAYIPTQAGTLEFPSTELKWWDITANSLKTTVIPAKKYNILTENGKAAPVSSVSTQATAISTTTYNSQTSNKNLWFYLAITAGFLWVITLIIAIIIFILRKKSRAKPTDNPPANKPLSNKKSLIEVESACKNKDINTLNSALINWASLHWQKKIYTVLDIKDLTSNEKLKILVEKLNQTLYRGSSFDQFDEFAREVSQETYTKAQSDSNDLKELYPK